MRSIVGASIGSYPHRAFYCGKEATFERIGLLLAEELKEKKTFIRSEVIPRVRVYVLLPRGKVYSAGALERDLIS